MLTPSSFTAIHTRVFSLEDSWAGCRDRKGLSDAPPPPQLEILRKRGASRGSDGHPVIVDNTEHSICTASGMLVQGRRHWPWALHPTSKRWRCHTCQHRMDSSVVRTQAQLGAGRACSSVSSYFLLYPKLSQAKYILL